MADKRFIIFGFCLQIFQLCAASNAEDFEEEYHEDGDYKYTDSYSSDENQLSAGSVVGIVVGAIFAFMLWVGLCYCRFKSRSAPVITRTVCVQPVRTVGIVIVRDRNPLHAGYDQGQVQPSSPPPYVERMAQTEEPNQGPTRTDNPPPYTAART